MKGIDVSSYQGNINWKEAKEKGGVQFAILKVIRKDLNPDKKFEQNWKGCMDAGIPTAVYNYFYSDPVKSANAVLKTLNGRKCTVWLDWEDQAYLGKLGHEAVNIINQYAKIIMDAGCGFGIYTGKDFFKSYLKAYAKELPYKFWLARYPDKVQRPLSYEPNEAYNPSSVLAGTGLEFYGWQFSSTGKVPGCPTVVDMNKTYSEEPLPNKGTVVTPPAEQETSGTSHVQLNYQVGKTYHMRTNMKVRSTASFSPDNVLDTFKADSENAYVKNYATTAVDGSIFMYIGQRKYGNVLRDCWICADDGTKCYLFDDGEHETPVSDNTPVSTKNEIIALGQVHANNFAGCELVVDGVSGPATKKAKGMVLQQALNLDYNSALELDGVVGSGTKKVLANHYVKLGETQYLVTAAEILYMLNGIDPKGVECPGKYGNGLKEASGLEKITSEKFLELVK